MRYAVLFLVVAAVALAGCNSLPDRKLKEGMTSADVGKTFLTAPKTTYSKVINGRTVEVWDYEQETMCIPNPIDDYWCVLPPTTKIVRVWLLDGKVKSWQDTKCSGYAQVCKLDTKDEWGTPPDFTSPKAPAFIRELGATGGRPAEGRP